MKKERRERMEKKYELIPSDIEGYQRIRALRDFISTNGHYLRAVLKGEIGGNVSSPESLSQEGSCWIFDDARVLHNARVSEDAIIAGQACVRDDAQVRGHGHVDGAAFVGGKTVVSGAGRILQRALVLDSKVLGFATVCGNATVRDSVVKGFSVIRNNTILKGHMDTSIEPIAITFDNIDIVITDNKVRIDCKVFTFEAIFELYDRWVNDKWDDVNLEDWGIDEKYIKRLDNYVEPLVGLVKSHIEALET
jgi:carbonic anhydrase/acetyltransferase-like protein (isoleucine patch superfamily)